ncbi:MAG: hypothetical protein GY757_44945 [bacterium]|nr:hypothetical protein [bacterium]
MSNIIETYLTIDKEYGPEEFKEKGSRFVSYLYPADSKETADTILAAMRKKFYDSTHVCFAYRLGHGKEDYFRFNDDGEPSGTAGLPIYNEIKSKKYFNVLVAVVRYYGGTKLGTGGLTRAYGQSAKMVLEVSGEVIIHLKKRLSVSFPFDFTGEIMQVVNRFGLDIVNQEYSAEGIDMLLDIPVIKVEDVAKQIIERSGGKIKIKEEVKKSA